VEPITKIVSGLEIVVEFRSSQETKVPVKGQLWILIVAIGASMFVAWSSLYLIYQGKANLANSIQNLFAPSCVFTTLNPNMFAPCAESYKSDKVTKNVAMYFSKCGSFIRCAFFILQKRQKIYIV